MARDILLARRVVSAPGGVSRFAVGWLGITARSIQSKGVRVTTTQQSRGFPGRLSWIAWVVLIPVVTGIGIVIGGTVEFVLAFVIFIAARLSLGIRQFGLMWSLLTNVCAVVIAVSSMLGQWSYIALRGEDVSAVVAKNDGPYGTQYELTDPKTGEDLGTLIGKLPADRSTIEPIGESLDVRVVRGSDLPALTPDRADLGRQFAAAWVLSWLTGIALFGYATLRRRRGHSDPGQLEAATLAAAPASHP